MLAFCLYIINYKKCQDLLVPLKQAIRKKTLIIPLYFTHYEKYFHLQNPLLKQRNILNIYSF